MTSPRRLAMTAALLVALAGCSAGGGGSTPSAAPSEGPSGAAGACPTTPAPSADAVSAWQGSQAPSIFPLIINPPGTLACGQNRMMFSFLDAQNAPVASPDRTVKVAVYDLGASSEQAVAETDARFIWAIEGERGVYVADVDLPTAGAYGAEFTTQLADAAPETIKVTFDSAPEPTVISVGDEAPASDTPTLGDVAGDVTKLSTDADPVESFYEVSVADALTAKEPFVLVFATPKFCATEQCGPTLDRIKPIAADHPDLTFINVEPYQLEEVEGQLQPVLTEGALTPAPATVEWRLPSEPWVFVVDRDGIVQGSFMLIVGDDELETAIEAVS
jgi:hypothetical protein